ncbi:MAG: flavocytochrome c, partial [Oscillospiraceae bacterium]
KVADVIVIGGGGAGLSAAISAFENGAKSVILIEKMAALGGNTIRAGGAMNAVNPEKQKKQNIEDSIEKHYEQTLKGGHDVANPELVRVLVENALDAVKWLESYGVEFKPEIGSVVGSMWKRSNQTVAPLGTGYIDGLGKAAKDKGCEIILETKATELIMDGNKVVGVKAEDAKTNYTLKANKGVVVATGGYAANPEMVREYLSDGVYTTKNLPADISTTNAPGLQGDGIKMAEAIGAQLVDMQHIQLLPMPSDRFGPSINVEDSFFINKEGVRYVKEDGARDEICLATFAQTDGQYFMINDGKIIGKDRKTLSGEDLDDLIKKGTVVEAPTLEELAKKIGVPADALKATTEKFNTYVDKKTDPDFGRKVWSKKIDTAPFYATLRFPALHHTMGGVKIDKAAHVLNADNKPIEGLFAAGEVTGGIHGANRLGGNAITDIIVFGRIAGASVMGK